MIKILSVCGMGLGSSLLAKMTAERVLDRSGLVNGDDYVIEVADLGSSGHSGIDLYITTHEFVDDLTGRGAHVIEVTNVFDETEMARKLLPVIEEIKQN